MQVGAILEAYGVESAPHATSQSPWQSFRLSTVNELSKNQSNQHSIIKDRTSQKQIKPPACLDS